MKKKIPPIPKRTQTIMVKLTSLLDIKDMMADIREAKKLARRTGGTYHVSRVNDYGDKIVLEIAFSHLECGG